MNRRPNPVTLPETKIVVHRTAGRKVLRQLHWQPVRRRYRIALITSWKSTARGRPRGLLCLLLQTNELQVTETTQLFSKRALGSYCGLFLADCIPEGSLQCRSCLKMQMTCKIAGKLSIRETSATWFGGRPVATAIATLFLPRAVGWPLYPH